MTAVRQEISREGVVARVKLFTALKDSQMGPGQASTVSWIACFLVIKLESLQAEFTEEQLNEFLYKCCFNTASIELEPWAESGQLLKANGSGGFVVTEQFRDVVFEHGVELLELYSSAD